MYWKESESTSEVVVYSMHDGDGGIATRAFFEDVSRLPVRFQLWELEPGVSEGSHTHEGEDSLEEVYYFLGGTGSMWVDGEDVPVAAGDFVLVPPGADHGFRNDGTDPLKLLIIWGRPRE